MQLPFVKMHSAGNDFIVVDAFSTTLALDADKVRRLADRRFGIGCDQLLVVEPATQPGFDFFFRVYNTDGSESGQCGNGVRCFHRFIVEQGLSDSVTLRHQTTTTAMSTRFISDGMVSVTLSEPEFRPDRIPFLIEGADEGTDDVAASEYQLDVDGESISIGVVSMGNPHAVYFTDSVDDRLVSRLGPRMEQHARFPERVNAGFAEVIDRQTIKLRVHERGVGETLACGSGACAAVAVGIRQNRLDESVSVQLPGGVLSVQWHGAGSDMVLTGSAERVFDGVAEI